MSRYLVTGAGGFAGKHLMCGLLKDGHEVTGLVRKPGSLGIEGAAEVVCDLSDEAATEKAIADARPEGIFHLAAPEVSPGHSWKDPGAAVTGNVGTTRSVLEAASALDPKPRILLVSSGGVYGGVPEDRQPIAETEHLNPSDPYGESKARCEELTRWFGDKRGLPVIIARSFNHTGPGQRGGFALPDFATQIAEIEARGSGEISVGNLDAARDFLDVRDVVDAYRILMEQGVPGEAYNVASGEAHSIGHLLEAMLETSPATINVVVDEDRLRPSDTPRIEGDAAKLRALGWEPAIPIEQTLKELLESARNTYGKS